jgi:uncharacterized membrane protein YidH (DUF202 family)
MTNDELIKSVIGLILIVCGIMFLMYNIKETQKGFRSILGSDVKLYSAAIFLIVGGIILLYQGLIK